MEIKSLSDKFSALAVALMIILTAWGNASAMFIFGGLGLMAGFLIFRKEIGRSGIFIAGAAIVAAMMVFVVTRLLHIA